MMRGARSKLCSTRSPSSEVFFEVAHQTERLKAIEEKLARPELWKDPEEAQRLMRDRSRVENALATDDELRRSVDDLGALFELLAEGEDVGADLDRALEALAERVRTTELAMLLSGPSDRRSAVVAIHPGAGGTESQDWAEMLLRQYLRYCERKGLAARVVDLQPGEEAGVKSATVTVEGEYAYGLLVSESGVHRLVRISPYDAAKRRHTSFASVYVYPEVDPVEVAIKPDELRIDTFRSSGAGGQHVNVTDSAVRITHLPTGIVVQCQNERSQHKNRDSAMKVLLAKLYDRSQVEAAEKLAAETSVKREIAFGSQIRSYVLHPYKLVKDHRSGCEITTPDRVLDGDLDELVQAFLMWRKRGGAPVSRGE